MKEVEGVKVKDTSEGEEGEGSEGYFQPRLVSTGLERESERVLRGLLLSRPDFPPTGSPLLRELLQLSQAKLYIYKRLGLVSTGLE